MTIFLVSREYRGLAEAGGIKDVVREMAETWNNLGHKAAVLLPFYGFLSGKLPEGILEFQGNFNFQTPISFEVRKIVYETVDIHFFHLSSFRDKKGVYTYTADEEKQNPFHLRGHGHIDGSWMNIIFQRAVAEYLLGGRIRPDVVHCHDGHTAWIPVLLKTAPRYREVLGQIKTLVTIHNAGIGYHQEIQDWDPVSLYVGLEASVLETSRIGQAYDPLAAAGLYSHLNTVSPFYAQEIMDQSGQNTVGFLGNYLRERGIKLTGIFNGIDPKGKDPRFPKEAGLPYGFDPRKMDEGKRACRRSLSAKILYPREKIYGNLEQAENTVLFSMQSRITGQKGVEKLLRILPDLLPDLRLSFLIMGEGEKTYEIALQSLANEWSSQGRFVFINTYDESYSPLVFASGDFFLIPSLYEPCGLTDLKALLMGNIPIVHGVGGLKKITDHQTGLVMDNLEEDLTQTILEAARIALESPDTLAKMRIQGFEMVMRDFSWERVLLDHYEKLFRLIL